MFTFFKTDFTLKIVAISVPLIFHTQSFPRNSHSAKARVMAKGVKPNEA